MATIEISKTTETSYHVVVSDRIVTEHDVTLTREYARQLGSENEPEVLIRRSFEFLLERESNNSILRSFDLRVIGRYFPEYERVITGSR